MTLPTYTCGLVSKPAYFAPDVTLKHGETTARAAAAYLIGAGHGCDAARGGEPVDLAFSARAKASIDPELAAIAREIWRVAE